MGFSLVVGATVQVWCVDFLLQSKDSRMNRLRQLQQAGSQAVDPGSGAQAQQLWPTGFRDRDGTHVSCTGRWIL